MHPTTTRPPAVPRRHRVRARLLAGLAVSLGAVLVQTAPAPATTTRDAVGPGRAGAPSISRTGLPPSPRSGLGAAVCGTWVLYQVSSKDDLVRLRPQIEDALALPGVAGFSLRFPWDAVDLRGDRTSHPILRTARKIALSQGKALSIRFMAGAHTPGRVFDAGAAYYVESGRKVPLPWSNTTGDHQVFLRAYERYVRKLAHWSREHGVRLLHLSWYGQDWAELNHGAQVREAPGYTEKKWLEGHRRLIELGARTASRKLAVELPLSGYGPLSTGESAALATKVIREVGESNPRFFVQANGWDETQEWGSPNAQVEQDFDRIWEMPVRRGLQMIQPDGYDWAKVFARLDLSGATYAEVYLPSFWQVPGPTPAYDNNTRARIDQLEQEVKAFARQTC